MQLIQLAGENIVEVSGFSEINGIYLENTDLDISVAPARNSEAKAIQLSIKPGCRGDVMPLAFEIEMLAQRITLSQLVNGSSLFIVPQAIDMNLRDGKAIKAFLQKSGGIWLDRLPQECIREIVNHCSF
ncbi:hypothetical protein [Sporomusa termitida]|uniref:hypothetical protein n=1 Tax=Sporomusa termitida TaxID=2377 RepID=UPI0011867904|nr:hypothetical protein [Sporomusa termitida]